MKCILKNANFGFINFEIIHVIVSFAEVLILFLSVYKKYCNRFSFEFRIGFNSNLLRNRF